MSHTFSNMKGDKKMKKLKIVEYAVVSILAVAVACFEKYTTDKGIEDAKEEIRENVLKELRGETCDEQD